MRGIFNVFKKGLQKTKTSILRGFESMFSGTKKWDASTYRQLEESLISADLGVNVTMRLVKDIKDRYERGEIKTADDIIEIASTTLTEILSQDNRPVNENPNGPTVILMVGVNGAGKTTTTGKLAWKLKQEGKSVMLAACDTFRAAAIEQLKLWVKELIVQSLQESMAVMRQLLPLMQPNLLSLKMSTTSLSIQPAVSTLELI